MLRISTLLENKTIIEKFKQLLEKQGIEYQVQEFNEKQYADIYIIEIYNQEDLEKIKALKRYEETLCYVVGPQSYELASECIKLKVNLYLSKENFIDDFIKNQIFIAKDIQERFQFYSYVNNGIISQIRLSQIYYVESLRHRIIIHSVNGTFVERKNLSTFLNEIKSHHFTQIHKSFIVNKQWIKGIKGQEIVLKNLETLPIGRAYKQHLQYCEKGI